MENTAVEVDETQSLDTPERVDRGGYYLEKKGFEANSTSAGFEFTIIQFKSIQAAIAKYGEEKVLAQLNSSLASSLRTKAKNKLPNPAGASKEELKAAIQAYGDKHGALLLTEQEAEEHQPGDRGLTSPEAMLSLARKKVKEADKEANAERKAQLLKESKELKAKAVAIINNSLMED